MNTSLFLLGLMELPEDGDERTKPDEHRFGPNIPKGSDRHEYEPKVVSVG